jgi:hypothetical protein
VVARLGSAHELIERDVQTLAHVTEIARHFVCESSVSRPSARAVWIIFQAVLVGAGDKLHIPALSALEPGDRVGGDRFIGVADVRAARSGS